MAFGYDGSIRIDTNVNSRGFNKGISSMSQALRGLAGVIGAAFGVAAIVNFGRESVKAASRLSSALIGLQSIVEGQGRSFQKAQGFIDDYIKDGLVPMQDAVTAYKNLAMRGYSTEQIEKTMVALKDASAFGRNASMSMGDAVSSASEGLKNENSLLVDNAGVTKNVAKMWDDYAKSIGTTANKLTQQQKIQAEVNGILEESRYQVGDAEKVAGTYAGQIAVLSFNFEKLKVAVGEAIIPIAQAVLPAVNTMITAFTQLANVVAQVTTALFGSTAVKDQTESTEDLADSEKDAADSAGDMAGATDDAGAAAEKAAKKIKGSLAPFDDLKKITGSTAESMEDAAGSMEDQFDNIGGDKTLFGDVKVSEDILNFVDRLKAGLQELADIMKRIWKPFEDAWNKYGKKVVDAVKGALGAIWELLKAIGRTFLEVWENSGAEMILAGILGILAGIFGFIQTLAGQMKTVWDEMGQDLVEAMFFALSSVIELVHSIGSAFAEAWNSGIGEEILRTIMGILTDIFNIVGTLATKMREAWEANGNGVAIWTEILEIVSSVLGFVERLTGATLEWLGGVNLEPLVGSFRRLLEAVEPLVDVILEGLAWAYENVLLPLAGWVLEEAAPAAIELLSEAIGALSGVIEALQPLAIWILDSFLVPIAEWTGELFIAALQLITDALSWFTEHGEALKNIITGVFAAFALWKTIEFANYVKYIGALTHTTGWEALKNAISQVIFVGFAPLKAGVLKAFDAMKVLLITVWEQVKTFALLSVELAKQTAAWVVYYAKIAAATIAQWAQVAATTAWNAICAVATTLTTAFGAAVAFLTSPIGLVIIAIGALIAIVILLVRNWDKVKEAAGAAWDFIKEKWGQAAEWISENILSPIADAFTGAINFMLGAVEGFVNFFIGGVNAIINALNSISFDVPDWVPLIGGNTFGFDIQPVPKLNLPRLANGAVIPPNQQFAAILGDQRSGVNIETPLSTMVQAFESALSKGGYGGGNSSTTVILNADGKTLARVVVPHINDMTRSAGKPVLLI